MVKETTRESSTKKKRKSITVSEETDVDTYKKSIEFEESEALSRSAETDAATYISICQDIRKLLGDILKLKQKNSTDTRATIQEKCTEACVNVAALKKLNRMEKVRLVSAKEALFVEKQKVDSVNLQLQNLLYESNHLVSEFNKCLQFKSKDEQIELVPLEEFLQSAPESVTEKFKDTAAAMDTDENKELISHQLRMARLEWELQQRKNLAELCKTLEGEKKKIGVDIVECKKKLNGLVPKLDAVLEATKPLQEHLNLPLDKVRNEHKLANLLPDPLYVLYVNIDAYRQVYEMRMNIVISGDQEQAAYWKNLRVTSNPQDEEDSEPEIEQDSEEIIEVKKRRHRKSAKVDPREEKKKKLLEMHPLGVDVTLSIEEGLAIKLKFQYCSNLKIVTVGSDVTLPPKISGNLAKEILSGDSLIGELFENDFGTESPNPSNAYQFKTVDIPSFKYVVNELGYAFCWAQRICGLDFLSEQGFHKYDNKLSQSNIELIVKTLQKRLHSRYALAVQLQQLEVCEMPKIPSSVDVPKNAISSLTKWTSKSFQGFCQMACSKHLLDEEFVEERDTIYCAHITRGNAKLEAYIIIKTNYPIQPPIFAIVLNYEGIHNAINNDKIRDMERSVNIGWERYGSKSAQWLLTAQLMHTCAYLDVYLETQYSNLFPPKNVYFKVISGRTRKRPFKFKKIGSGVFV